MNYEQRAEIVSNLKQVSKVVPQKTLDYSSNLIDLKPDFVVHGDDWKEGIQKPTRDKVKDTLKEWVEKLLIFHTRKVFHLRISIKHKGAGTTPN